MKELLCVLLLGIAFSGFMLSSSFWTWERTRRDLISAQMDIVQLRKDNRMLADGILSIKDSNDKAQVNQIMKDDKQ